MPYGKHNDLRASLNGRSGHKLKCENRDPKGTKKIADQRRGSLEVGLRRRNRIERNAFARVCPRMNGYLRMALGAIGTAFLDSPGVEDHRGRLRRGVHGVIRPGFGMLSGALEARWTAAAELYRIRIPPERGPQPLAVILVNQMERDKNREIAAGGAIVALAGAQPNPEEVVQGYILGVRRSRIS